MSDKVVQVDARGYSCPTPLMMVQKTMKEKDAAVIEVLVDTQCAVENVSRFADSHGYKVEIKPGEDGECQLLLNKE